MSGLFKQFKTNQAKEVEGIEIDFPEAQNDDDSIPVFIISRMGKGNRAYSKALEAATRPYRRQVELGTMKNEIAEELFLGVFVDTVLKGWKNVFAEDGSAMPFNRENARKLMSDLPEVYDRLQEEAKMSSNFRDSALEAEAGN